MPSMAQPRSKSGRIERNEIGRPVPMRKTVQVHSSRPYAKPVAEGTRPLHNFPRVPSTPSPYARGPFPQE
jgi:hypothetical protein